jgi:hypothetical protein
MKSIFSSLLVVLTLVILTNSAVANTEYVSVNAPGILFNPQTSGNKAAAVLQNWEKENPTKKITVTTLQCGTNGAIYGIIVTFEYVENGLLTRTENTAEPVLHASMKQTGNSITITLIGNSYFLKSDWSRNNITLNGFYDEIVRSGDGFKASRDSKIYLLDKFGWPIEKK